MNHAVYAPRPFTLIGGLANTGSALNIRVYLCSSAADCFPELPRIFLSPGSFASSIVFDGRPGNRFSIQLSRFPSVAVVGSFVDQAPQYSRMAACKALRKAFPVAEKNRSP